MATVNGENGAQVVEACVAQGVSINVNATGATTLFTVPAGRTFVPTKVALRNASISLSTMSVAFGQNSASFNDFAATAVYSGLSAATKQAVVAAGTTGQTTCAAAAAFSANVTIAQGSAGTVLADLFGYLI